MNHIHRALTVSAILLASSNIAFADDFDPFFEIIAMGGISTLDAGNSTLQISPIEFDEQVQTNSGDWESWTAQLGVGYVYPFMDDLETGDVQWFPLVTPQINLYYLGGDGINGDVWRFQDPNFNQMDYQMDFNSTRLMFDLGLTVAAIDEFSIYAIGGLGLAWNRLGYNATEKSGVDCPISSLDLTTNNSTGFAYEFGGGITYAAFEDVAISLEYLYTGFNDVELGDGNFSGYDIQSSDVDINSQSILLGLRFAL